MRPIKFRQLISGKWHYWGFLEESVFISPANDTSSEEKQEESQQFTGLLDKNGKEIWIGDIVKGKIWSWKEEKFFEVKFDEDYYGILPFVEKYQSCEGEENLNSYSCEVIGNIYENPAKLSNNL